MDRWRSNRPNRFNRSIEWAGRRIQCCCVIHPSEHHSAAVVVPLYSRATVTAPMKVLFLRGYGACTYRLETTAVEVWCATV